MYFLTGIRVLRVGVRALEGRERERERETFGGGQACGEREREAGDLLQGALRGDEEKNKKKKKEEKKKKRDKSTGGGGYSSDHHYWYHFYGDPTKAEKEAWERGERACREAITLFDDTRNKWELGSGRACGRHPRTSGSKGTHFQGVTRDTP